MTKIPIGSWAGYVDPADPGCRVLDDADFARLEEAAGVRFAPEFRQAIRDAFWTYAQLRRMAAGASPEDAEKDPLRAVGGDPPLDAVRAVLEEAHRSAAALGGHVDGLRNAGFGPPKAAHGLMTRRAARHIGQWHEAKEAARRVADGDDPPDLSFVPLDVSDDERAVYATLERDRAARLAAMPDEGALLPFLTAAELHVLDGLVKRLAASLALTLDDLPKKAGPDADVIAADLAGRLYRVFTAAGGTAINAPSEAKPELRPGFFAMLAKALPMAHVPPPDAPPMPLPTFNRARALGLIPRLRPKGTPDRPTAKGKPAKKQVRPD